MHFKNIESAVTACDPNLLENQIDANCVKGCYRCLLSYYNQPDHETINRTDDSALRTLLRLAAGTTEARVRAPSGDAAWSTALSKWGLPASDNESLSLANWTSDLVWRSHLVVASFIEPSPDIRTELENRGFGLILVPTQPGELAPPELSALLKG
jgi:hypothetical protein